MTVAQAAASLGISTNHLYGVERGDYAPSLETLIGLAMIYKVDLVELFIFPATSRRHELYEAARRLPKAKVDEALAAFAGMLATRRATKRSP